MKILKTILGVLISIALIGSIVSFLSTTIPNEGTPEILGHLLVIIIFVFIIIQLFKPSKEK